MPTADDYIQQPDGKWKLKSALDKTLAIGVKQEPTVSDECIEQRIRLPTGNEVILRSEDIRKEKTGVHCKISIFLGSSPLAWDNFNVGRDADRKRLAKSAHEQLGDLGDAYSKEALKHDLDNFADSLWQLQVDLLMGKMLAGNDVLTAPTFLLKPFIIEGGGTILYGPPGKGKSFLGQLMAVSIDSGTSALWPVQESRVLLINLERSEGEIRRRLAAVNKVLNLPLDRELPVLNARGMALWDIVEAAKKTMKKFEAKVVFLDSISRSGFGDLTENAPTNKIIDTLNKLSSTWFGIAHTPRDDDTHVFGSVHFEAGADIMVQLLSQEKEQGKVLGLGLQVTKANDIPKQGIYSYALTFGDTGLIEARDARRCEFGEIEMGRRWSLTQQVTDYLLNQGDATATEIADALSRNRANISALLNTSEEFVRTRKQGHSQYFGVKENLPQMF